MSDAREHSGNPPPYRSLKVVEVASTPAAEYTGYLLAEMGAEVLRRSRRAVPPRAGSARLQAASMTASTAYISGTTMAASAASPSTSRSRPDARASRSSWPMPTS